MKGQGPPRDWRRLKISIWPLVCVGLGNSTGGRVGTGRPRLSWSQAVGLAQGHRWPVQGL